MCCARARYAPIFELSTPFCCATFFSCANADPAVVSAGKITKSRMKRGLVVLGEGYGIVSPSFTYDFALRASKSGWSLGLRQFCNTNQENVNPAQRFRKPIHQE